MILKVRSTSINQLPISYVWMNITMTHTATTFRILEGKSGRASPVPGQKRNSRPSRWIQTPWKTQSLRRTIRHGRIVPQIRNRLIVSLFVDNWQRNIHQWFLPEEKYAKMVLAENLTHKKKQKKLFVFFEIEQHLQLKCHSHADVWDKISKYDLLTFLWLVTRG